MLYKLSPFFTLCSTAASVTEAKANRRRQSSKRPEGVSRYREVFLIWLPHVQALSV